MFMLACNQSFNKCLLDERCCFHRNFSMFDNDKWQELYSRRSVNTTIRCYTFDTTIMLKGYFKTSSREAFKTEEAIRNED